MKKNFNKFSIFMLSVILVSNLLTSCSDDETIKGDYANGVFITNEGGWGNNNGSISFYSYDKDEVTNNIFQAVNGRQLGDVVQSITISGDNAYIVVNNSNKIEVADKNTMSEKGVIENLPSPRYMAVSSSTGYVSCWGDNSIRVVDLNTFSVIDTIYSTGSGPEKMLITDNKLYVVNPGGWSNDSTVTVINTESKEVIATIQVPYLPMDIVKDNSGNIWVLSYGNEYYNDDYTAIVGHTPSYLYKIDPSTNQVIASGELFAEQHPAHLEIDKDGSTLYVGGGYTFGGVYKIVISGLNLSIGKIADDYAYGLNYDSNSDVLFVALSGDYKSGGTLKRYDTDGNLLGTYTCGIGTSGAAFKKAK